MVFLMNKGAQKANSVFKELLIPYGITPVQYLVLEFLTENDGVIATHIAGKLVLDAATLTGVLDRLEKGRLIERYRDLSDRRAARVCLTEEGAYTAKKLRPIMEEANRVLVKDLSPEDIERMSDLLKQVLSDVLGDEDRRDSMTAGGTQAGKKALQSSSEASKIIKASYSDVQKAKSEGKPIVWVFGLVPREIFHALDVPIVTLEHLPVMISAKQLASKYLQVAEERGLSRDTCPFHRTAIGCSMSDDLEPYVQNLYAPPDLIVASNFPCMAESKSFLYLADQFNCPCFFLDAPINVWARTPPDYATEYYSNQLRELLYFLDRHGYQLDWNRIKESVDNSRQLMLLWEEINELRKVIPSPMGLVDGLNALFALIQLPGSKTGVQLFRDLRDELADRVKNKQGVIPEEKLRLLWVGIPPFYNLGILNYPEQYGGVVIKGMAEYLAGGAFDPRLLNPDKPLESLATKVITDIINPVSTNMIDFMVDATRQYQIDGIISTVKRTCGLLPGMTRLVKDAVYEQTGVPSTIFDLDGLDQRDYDDTACKASIDSFMEALLARKATAS